MFNIIDSNRTSDTYVNETSWWKFVTLGLVYILLLATETSGQNWVGDFGQYLHHAMNIAEGRPYAEIGYIHNTYAFVGPAAYPPVFPLLLAPVYSLFGLDWFVLKAVVIASFCLSLYLIISLEQMKLSRAHQFTIIFILALNPYFWWMKGQVLSEFTFMLLCLLTLLALSKRYIKDATGYRDAKNKSWSFAVLVGLLLYLSFATKDIGIVFIPAILCFELFHFKKITLVTCVTLLVFLALVGLQNVILQEPEANIEMNQRVVELASERGERTAQADHFDYIKLDLGSMVKQAMRYTSEMRDMWPETGSKIVSAAGWIAFTIAFLFAFTGYIRAVISGPGLLEIFVAGYLAILILFGGWQGLRYLVPVIPFFFIYAFKLHDELLCSQYRKIMIAIAALFVSATTVVYASNYNTYLEEKNRGITSPEAEAFLAYVKNSTSEDSVFIFQRPRILSLLTGRHASSWPGGRDQHLLFKYMKAIGAKYLVFSNINWEGLSYPVESVSLPEGNFILDYRNDNFYVYKLDNSS